MPQSLRLGFSVGQTSCLPVSEASQRRGLGLKSPQPADRTVCSTRNMNKPGPLTDAWKVAGSIRLLILLLAASAVAGCIGLRFKGGFSMKDPHYFSEPPHIAATANG